MMIIIITKSHIYNRQTIYCKQTKKKENFENELNEINSTFESCSFSKTDKLFGMKKCVPLDLVDVQSIIFSSSCVFHCGIAQAPNISTDPLRNEASDADKQYSLSVLL